MGFFGLGNDNINQLAKKLIFLQIEDDLEEQDKIIDELVKSGKRGSESLLVILDREKNNPNINWDLALTTLHEISSYGDSKSREFLKKAISIYQQSISKNLKIYNLLLLYNGWGMELTNFAHQELVKIGNNNFDSLLDALNCHMKMILKIANRHPKSLDITFLKLLLEFKNNKSIKFLINLFKNDKLNNDISNIRFINGIMVDFGSQTLPSLTNLLFDSNVELKREIARALGEIGDQRALQPLTRVLQDTDPDVRIRAHESIEKICKTHNLNPQQFIQQSQSKNRSITEIKNNHPNQVNDPVQRLKKVKELLDMGVITREEFERKKKQLLERI